LDPSLLHIQARKGKKKKSTKGAFVILSVISFSENVKGLVHMN